MEGQVNITLNPAISKTAKIVTIVSRTQLLFPLLLNIGIMFGVDRDSARISFQPLRLGSSSQAIASPPDRMPGASSQTFLLNLAWTCSVRKLSHKPGIVSPC